MKKTMLFAALAAAVAVGCSAAGEEEGELEVAEQAVFMHHHDRDRDRDRGRDRDDDDDDRRDRDHRSKGTLDAPSLRVTRGKNGRSQLEVCAGASGAPAGFVVQWRAPRGSWPDDSCRHGSRGYSGQAKKDRALAPFACTEVSFNNRSERRCSAPPMCTGNYKFRVFAQATSKLQRSANGSDVSVDCSKKSGGTQDSVCSADDWDCFCNVNPELCY